MKTPVRLTSLLALILIAICGFSGSARADDGASSISAGGIVSFKREPRITMAKEVLRIEGKITVDYDFRNDTDEDVTTLVAFPIPAYSPDGMHDHHEPAEVKFDDFSLWINNAPAKYKTQARAFVNGKDLTALLEKMHVDVANFGHTDEGEGSPEIQKLTDAQRERLERAGLIECDGAHNCGTLWEVHKEYYWLQTFPAHSTTHIRHAYTPVGGYYASGGPDDPAAFCVNRKLKETLRKAAMEGGYSSSSSWVNFILTSANTWKTPIEDFTLIVEGNPEHMSFCWDGPVEKIDAAHVMARAVNFVPKRELAIVYYSLRKLE